MSETTTEEAAQPQAEQPTQADTSIEQAATEGFDQQQQGGEEQPQEEQPAEQPKKSDQPGWVKPAIDRLTREKHEARRALEAAQKENAILRQMAEGKLPAEQRGPLAPDATEDEILERKAQELLARRDEAKRRNEMIQSGVKELGENTWNEKTEILHHLGATNNEAFMRAVMTVPDGHKVVAALADDPTRVMGLLQRSPLEMATEIGAMAAEIHRKPAARKITSAPSPGAAVNGRTVSEPNLYDPNISMAEFARLWDKRQADRAKARGLR